MGSRGLMLAKAAAVAGVVLVQTIVLGGLGFALGWQPRIDGVVPAVLLLALGCWVFVALALTVAGRIRAEGVLVVANLLWVLFAVGGGLLMPTSRYPDAWAAVVKYLPTGALGRSARRVDRPGKRCVADARPRGLGRPPDVRGREGLPLERLNLTVRVSPLGPGHGSGAPPQG